MGSNPVTDIYIFKERKKMEIEEEEYLEWKEMMKIEDNKLSNKIKKKFESLFNKITKNKYVKEEKEEILISN